MSVELLVPTLGESVVEATVSKWIKKVGDPISIDEPLVELETEKVTLEVPSPVEGVLGEISCEEGSSVEVGAVLGILNEGEKAKLKEPSSKQKNEISEEAVSLINDDKKSEKVVSISPKENSLALSPAVQRMITENNLLWFFIYFPKFFNRCY